MDGLKPATRDDPYRNLMKAPYWTDGRRVVLLLSDESVPLKDIEFFDWDWGRVRWSREEVKEQETPVQ